MCVCVCVCTYHISATLSCSNALPSAEPGREHSGGTKDEEQGAPPTSDDTAGQRQPRAADTSGVIPQEAEHLCGK